MRIALRLWICDHLPAADVPLAAQVSSDRRLTVRTRATRTCHASLCWNPSLTVQDMTHLLLLVDCGLFFSHVDVVRHGDKYIGLQIDIVAQMND